METNCYLPQDSMPDLNQAITPSGAYQLSYFFAFFHLNMQTHVCVWAVRIGYYRSRKTITVPVIIVNCAFKLVLSTELFTTYAYLHSYTIPIPRGRNSFVLSHNVVVQDILTALLINHATNSRHFVTTPQNYLQTVRHLGSVTRGIVNIVVKVLFLKILISKRKYGRSFQPSRVEN